MTRRDYELIANAVYQEVEYWDAAGDEHAKDAVIHLAKRLAAEFLTTNPRFDLSRFLTASVMPRSYLDAKA